MRKVFVSSTSTDLKPYRQAVNEVVLELGWHPVMMEHFGTGSSFGIVETCTRRVAESDLVIAILGWRLGWVPDMQHGADGTRSITRIELETAKGLGKPIVALFARDDWPGKLWETEPERRRLVEELRDSLDRPAVFFSWEPSSPAEAEPLPQFRTKVKQELLRFWQSVPTQAAADEKASTLFKTLAVSAETIARSLTAKFEPKRQIPLSPQNDETKPTRSGELLLAYLEEAVPTLHAANRSAAVLEAVERALPLSAGDFRTLGIISWALDYFPGRSSHYLERRAAATLRKRVLAPFVEHRPPPPLPGPRDPDWTGALGGSFFMGSLPADGRDADERPVHEVRLSPFRMLIRPVTTREFGFSSLRGKPGSLPAVDLDWYLAYAYAAWRGGRLPTEAEWEFAARGGTGHDYSDRDGLPTTIEKVAWHGANSDRRPHPVMQLEPNSWGLYDMVGSVWEWVADWFGRYPGGRQVDPWGPPSGAGRVLRGGSVWDDARTTHPAYRGNWFPRFGFVDIGFRIVLPAGRV